MDGDPYVVLEYNFLRMQQRKPVAQTKIKNLRTGKTIQRTFHQNESFKEAEIGKETIIYIYNNRGKYWFHKEGNRKERFSIDTSVLGNAVNFLKENTEVTASIFKKDIINISIPVKMDLQVTETPPGVRGNTAQGGSKEAILETGYKLQVPFFINPGDIVRVNTETGEYTERVEKV